MKLVMTLLARDEADIVDANLAFHLSAGVDFVIATDNRSTDGTTEILEAYEREGRLRLIREPGDDYRQGEWVTRMARLAATEHGADWIISSDADEFWWPRDGDLKAALATVPTRYGVVRGFWRVFAPRPGEGVFAERMTVRLSPYADQSTYDGPFHPQVKNAYRADPTVRVAPGCHDVFGERLRLLRGWYPFDVLHFPVRTLEQSERKYVHKVESLSRNPHTPPSDHAARTYAVYRERGLRELYDGFVVSDAALERGLRDGTMEIDTRLRDALRLLPAPAYDDAMRRYVPGSGSLDFRPPSLQDEVTRAVDVAALPDTYGRLEHRLRELENRLTRSRAPLSVRVLARAARALGVRSRGVR
jgi:Glycosyl transferase family 2